jgi:hypothetical protein
MRIISDFRDYYDASQALGHDPTVVYLRKQKEILIPDFPFPTTKYRRCLWYYRSWDRDINEIKSYTIGFCGKIYAVIQMRASGEEKYSYCYTIKAVDAFMEKYCKKKDIEAFRKKQKWNKLSTRDNFKKFFDDTAAKRDAFENIFVENGVPIFLAEEGRTAWNAPKKPVPLTANVELKQYQFYKVFDTYTAFQEIEMYLSSIAVPSKEMPEITDVLKADSKGFDKFSFRADSSPRKQRRKRRRKK